MIKIHFLIRLASCRKTNFLSFFFIAHGSFSGEKWISEIPSEEYFLPYHIESLKFFKNDGRRRKSKGGGGDVGYDKRWIFQCPVCFFFSSRVGRFFFQLKFLFRFKHHLIVKIYWIFFPSLHVLCVQFAQAQYGTENVIFSPLENEQKFILRRVCLLACLLLLPDIRGRWRILFGHFPSWYLCLFTESFNFYLRPSVVVHSRVAEN